MPPRKKEEDAIRVEIKLSAEVQKLDVRDGDLVVMKIKSDDVSPEVLKAIRKNFREQVESLNKASKVIAFVIPPPQDIEFTVVRAGETPDAETQAALDQQDEEQAGATSTLDVGEQS